MSVPTNATANVSVHSSTFTSGRDTTVNMTVNSTHLHTTEPTSGSLVSKWLSKFASINQYSIQDETHEKVSPGTCAWVLEESEFEKWISGRSRTFWGIGMPGAGKTILTSFVVHHLKSRTAALGTDDAVIFFYCRYNNEPSIKQILAALLHQLVDYSTAVEAHVKDTLYTTCAKQDTEPTRAALELALRYAIDLVSKVAVVIDALDELADYIREELVDLLVSWKVSLFVTSRELTLESLSSPNMHVRAPDADFRSYIAREIAHLPKLRSLLNNRKEVLSEVVDSVIQKSDGMFLLSALQLAALGGITTIKSLRESIKYLPTTLAGMYEVTLERIKRQTPEESSLALRAIFWATYALQPLSTVELQAVLADDLDQDAFADQGTLRSVCCGLLSIEEGGVRLIHYTTHDFFQQCLEEPFDDPHTFAANICATYQDLYYTIDPGGQEYHNTAGTRIYELYPFLNYTIVNMGLHTHQSALRHNGKIPSLVEKHLSEPQEKAIIEVPYPGEQDSGGLIHFSARYGLLDLITRKANPRNIDQPSERNKTTPLIYACHGGHPCVVEFLLQTDMVNIDARDRLDFTPLSAASCNGNINSVKLLIESGATLDADGLALVEACNNGHLEVAQLLLTHPALRSQIEADANILNGGALHEAAFLGQLEIVKTMLACPGIDINSVTKNGRCAGRTPLLSALLAKNLPMINLLLDLPGIDYNAGGWGHYSVLQLAAEAGLGAVVEKLLGFPDLDINVRDGQGRTPLHSASYFGKEECVQLLLESGLPIDINERILGGYWRGRTALGLAISQGHARVAMLLHRAGAAI